MRLRLRISVGLLAAGAALVIAPATAAGKATEYVGPIDAIPHPSEPEVLIRFKVHYKDGKPKQLFPVEIKGVREYCENGSSLGIGGGLGGGFLPFPMGVLVKKRKFAETQFPGVGDEDTWTITGTIPKRGDASGGLHIVERPAIPGDEDIAQYGTCDTGPLAWTAARVG